MEEKLTIDKLEGSANWATWKFQMEHSLKAKGLWEHVMGNAVLAEGAIQQAQADHQKRVKGLFQR